MKRLARLLPYVALAAGTWTTLRALDHALAVASWCGR
jgi:hypothetical protein